MSVGVYGHAGTRPLRAPAPLAPFAEAGVLAAADTQVAGVLSRLAGGVDDDVLLACAMAVRAVRLGHTCVDLANVAERAAVDGEVLIDPAELPWPEPAKWASACGASPLAGDAAPLVLEDGRLLYLDRYWHEERQVARNLLALSAAPAASPDADVLRDGLDRLFPSTDPQRAAAETALKNRLAVMAGGPGTGKTRTVARIVALHVEQALASGAALPQIGLAAPTGKAAARLTEAIAEQQEELGETLAAPAREALASLRATTLHRLLGWRPDSQSRFRHNRGNRLPHDLVVVDETSMVSLTLMARLLEALRPGAGLLLVGDPGQLASVDAGTVLGDLVAASEPAGSPLHGITVLLTDPHRFRDGIDEVAKAIHSGDPEAVVDALRSNPDDVTWIEGDPAEPGIDLEPVRERSVEATRAVRAAAAAGDVRRALDALGAFRLLLAHRRGTHGVSTWNRQVERWTTSVRDREDEWYVGRPVLVGSNDASLGIFNGDLGVVVQQEDHRTVAFDRRPDALEITPARLGDVQTVHAMTIHKSQGSQFEAVAVLLPDQRSRILTRELLYTAVTRAKERLVVVGDEAVVRAAVARPIDRATGLASRLTTEEGGFAP